MSQFKLSATLEGHTSDVRAVLLPDPSWAATASRDGTARVWTKMSSSPPKYDHIEATQGASYKTCLAYLEPSKEYPDGLIFIGGQDTVIEAKRPGQTGEEHAEAIMVGHGNQISALDVNSKAGWLVSGSWDHTARLWQIGKWESDIVLKGHGQSVTSVLAFDDDTIVTGCADKGIRVFDTNGKIINQFDGHDIVRALCKVPKGHPSGAQIASGANDGVIRLWTLDGRQIWELYGHNGEYIYALASLPSGEIVSVSEDRTLRVWKGTECVQVITHPAISVWSVAVCTKNGDVVTGASDGKARVFSRDPNNQASEDAIKQFDDEVSAMAIPKQTVGDIPTHPPEYLEQRHGTKEGQTVVIKHLDGSLVAYQWSLQTQNWVQAGVVTEAAGGGEKIQYKGEQYDYVWDVAIEDGQPSLKLPYNRGQNPYDAATKFLQDQELPMTQLEQVAAFIIENTKGQTIGSDSGPPTGPPPVGADPWGTESRYRPGQALSAPSSNQAAKPSSDSSIALPQKAYVGLVQSNLKGVQKRILELNQRRATAGDSDSALSPPQLESLSQLFKQLEKEGPPDTATLDMSMPVLVKIATIWNPPGDRLAGLDLLRQLSLRTPKLAQYDFDGQTLVGIVISSGAFDPAVLTSAPNVAMMAVRIFCNLYLTPPGCALIASHDTFDNIINLVRKATHRQNASRMMAMAAATYYINTAVFLTAPHNTDEEQSFERGLQVLENALDMLKVEIDTVNTNLTGKELKDTTEYALRFLTAIGTLLVALGEGTIRDFAKDEQLYGLRGVLDNLQRKGFTKDSRIANMVTQIKKALA